MGEDARVKRYMALPPFASLCCRARDKISRAALVSAPLSRGGARPTTPRRRRDESRQFTPRAHRPLFEGTADDAGNHAARNGKYERDGERFPVPGGNIPPREWRIIALLSPENRRIHRGGGGWKASTSFKESRDRGRGADARGVDVGK